MLQPCCNRSRTEPNTAGFADVVVSTLPITAKQLDPSGYVARQIAHMLAVVGDRGTLSDHECAAIEAEQHELSRAGRFSFHLDRTIVTARRPATT